MCSAKVKFYLQGTRGNMFILVGLKNIELTTRDLMTKSLNLSILEAMDFEYKRKSLPTRSK